MPEEPGRRVQGPRPSSSAIRGATGPDDTVHLVGSDAGVGQSTKCADERNRHRVVIGQGAGLHRVVDAGDGDAGERMW